MEMTTIEIDFDIYKLIEGERRSFSEQPFHALRRLLSLPPAEEAPSDDPTNSNAGQPWIDDGVVIPHGSLARMEYGRGSQQYSGKFLDGSLVVNGLKYQSLSEAAGALAKTKSGGATSLNGWNYWEVQLPGSDRWELLDHVRRRARGKAVL